MGQVQLDEVDGFTPAQFMKFRECLFEFSSFYFSGKVATLSTIVSLKTQWLKLVGMLC